MGRGQGGGAQTRERARIRLRRIAPRAGRICRRQIARAHEKNISEFDKSSELADIRGGLVGEDIDGAPVFLIGRFVGRGNGQGALADPTVIRVDGKAAGTEPGCDGFGAFEAEGVV